MIYSSLMHSEFSFGFNMKLLAYHISFLTPIRTSQLILVAKVMTYEARGCKYMFIQKISYEIKINVTIN